MLGAPSQRSRLAAARFTFLQTYLMRVSIFLLLGGCLTAGLTQAQSFQGVGLRLGGNLASGTFATVEQATGPGVDYTYQRSSLLGYQVGLAATFGSGHWAVQPALVFTQKGLKQTATAKTSFGGYDYQEKDDFKARIHYLELPLNLVYSFGDDGEGIQVFAGPYLAMGVGGRNTYALELSSSDPDFMGPQSESGTQAFTFGSTFSEPDPNSTSNSSVYESRARRFDAGLNFGVGYRRGPMQVQLGYGLGLLNAQPKYPASYQMTDDTGYIRTAQLTATYYFPVGGR